MRFPLLSTFLALGAAALAAHNATARQAMGDLGVPVNDLYAVVFARLNELQRPANVHFTDEGSQVLAEPVTAAIRRLLAPCLAPADSTAPPDGGSGPANRSPSSPPP